VKCLVCMLEFPNWKLAKPWSYISGYALVDALRDLGHEVELSLLFNLADASDLEKTLANYAESGRRFDFAFFCLPHLNYTAEFWRMAERIAERRIMILVESLRYSWGEIIGYPDLAGHYLWRARNRSRWVGWLNHCTHVVTMDYNDYLELRDAGYSVFWTPGLFPNVPEKVFVPWEEKSLRFLTAATVYGRRRKINRVLSECGIVDANDRLQHDPALIAEFETAIAAFINTDGDTEEKARQAERVRVVRLALWHEYLRYISKFAGIISLPAYFKGFPGRVLEGILARCSIFICAAYGLERQKRVFLPGEHINYLSSTPSQADLAQIIEVARDADYRKKVTSAARERAFAFCEASFLTAALLDWARNVKARPAHRVLSDPTTIAQAKNDDIVEVGYEAC
jgi:hypothetical protein